jgi:hypothetical protein
MVLETLERLVVEGAAAAFGISEHRGVGRDHGEFVDRQGRRWCAARPGDCG